MSETAQRTSSGPTKMLLHPVDTMTTAVDHVPGAAAVKGAASGVLDAVGIVSPHARRVAAYAGVGLLGAAGVVEWPVAAAGAAVVWLTQPRPKEVATTTTRTTRHKPATHAARAGGPKTKATAKATGGTAGSARTTRTTKTPKKAGSSGTAKASTTGAAGRRTASRGAGSSRAAGSGRRA